MIVYTKTVLLTWCVNRTVNAKFYIMPRQSGSGGLGRWAVCLVLDENRDDDDGDDDVEGELKLAKRLGSPKELRREQKDKDILSFHTHFGPCNGILWTTKPVADPTGPDIQWVADPSLGPETFAHVPPDLKKVQMKCGGLFF